MQLKKLELLGFKSFVERTAIEFKPGVTTIVGPNGCGKSNLVDAVRWVMGEQSAKHLRGGSMDDVIFSGSQKRAPLGMSEVFLTFENNKGLAPAAFAEYSEIEIGRRLYKSGESEYLINKTPCRLKDIHEFFLGTGVGTKAYSIVEQGTIGSLISARPEDKRRFIEEAAGISKFKARKETAQRKMDSTRANLLRLNDIISELKRQVNSLNRQARKAERFKEVRDELEKRELAYLSTKYKRMMVLHNETDAEHKQNAQNVAADQAKISSTESKLDQMRLEAVEQEQQLETLQRDLYSTQSQLRLDEAEIAHRQREKDELGSNCRLWEEESSELTERIRNLQKKQQDINDQKVRSDCFLAEVSSRLIAAEKQLQVKREGEDSTRNELNKIRKQHQQSSEEKAILLARLEEQHRQQDETEKSQIQYQNQKKDIDKKIQQFETEAANKKSKLENTKELADKLGTQTETLKNEIDVLKSECLSTEESFNSARRELEDKKSKLNALEDLENNKEGFSNGVKAVLSKKTEDVEFKGIIGTIRDLVEVDEGFEAAAGAVLGEKIHFVAVESRQNGMKAVQYLKSLSDGRGTFVPTEVLPKPFSSLPSNSEVIGHLADHVRLPSSYNGIHKYLFGDAILVKNLDTAIDLWSSTQGTYVTMEGEVVDSHGVISGGPGGFEQRQLTQKRRIEQLKEQIFELNAKLSSCEQAFTNSKNKLEHTVGTQESLQKQIQNEHIKALAEEKEWQRLDIELSSHRKRSEEINKSIEHLSSKYNERRNEILSSTGKAEEIANGLSKLEVHLSNLEQSAINCGAELKSADEETTKFRISQAEAQSKAESTTRHAEELASSRATAILELERRSSLLSFAKRRTKTIDEDQTRSRNSLEAAVKNAAKLEEEQRQKRSAYDLSSIDIRKHDAELREQRQSNQKLVDALHHCDMELEKQRSQVEHLVERTLEFYHKSLPEIADSYFSENLNEEEEDKIVFELKQKLEKIGGVDTEALSEREELTNRLEFMEHQRTDLETSLDALNRAIIRINKTSRKRFEETFAAVDNEFQRLFPRLFKGGSAKLTLGEGDVLEAGVEIMVQPPGKRLQAMSLLSGGEKALTAVAMVFAIFLVKPSPFCLLDEVDAPLDDVNIDRFNDLVKSMVSRSQFVIITHNKRTMELADVMYGVTMAEPGISRIVSAKFEEVDNETEAKSA